MDYFKRKSVWLRLAIMIGCTALIIGCTDSQADVDNDRHDPLEQTLALQELEQLTEGNDLPDYSQAAAANRAFALDWFDALLTEHEGDNLIISPYSASVALAMTLRGTDSNTFAELAGVLHAGEMDEADYHLQQAALLRHLYRQQEDIVLLTANSIWHTDSRTVDEVFLTEVAQYYGAKIAGVDFSDPQTPADMNRWVKDHTAGKIDSIVSDPIEGDPFMYLINALYVKAPWYDPFQEDRTENRAFHLPGGEQVHVPMMQQQRTMQAMQSDDFKAVRLALGDNAELSMYLVLPEEGKRWADIRQVLEEAEAWRNSFNVYSVDLAFPKFRMEQSIDLIESLKQMGITQLFDETRADLGRMAGWDIRSGDRLFVDEALQKTFIEVNEQGLEAAAVTSIRSYPTSMPEPMTAVFDRPFYFWLEDNESGAVLFTGAVRDPR
ncbi:serpin family protein [Paenibacillaceae bacterium WGS1546]|uniref:serpin family protein n=1 Tax=Cohnella sp. WGS1546 TaxID=3366810 RepID=UPI00372D6813